MCILNLITKNGVIGFTSRLLYLPVHTCDRRMGRSAIASTVFFSKIKRQLMSSELECTLHYSLLRRHIHKQKSTIYCYLYMCSVTHCTLHIYTTQIPCFSFNPPKNVCSYIHFIDSFISYHLNFSQ